MFRMDSKNHPKENHLNHPPPWLWVQNVKLYRMKRCHGIFPPKLQASTRHCGPPLGLGFARASTKRPFRFSQTIFHASVFSGWRMEDEMNPLDALRLETLILLMVQKSGDHQLDMVNITLFKGFHRCQVVSTQLRKNVQVGSFPTCRGIF